MEKGNFSEERALEDELKLVKIKARVASSTWNHELHHIGSGAGDRNMAKPDR